jgi:hypothetical protein
MVSYRPPPRGFRTFVIVWFTQSTLRGRQRDDWVALNIYLVQVLLPTLEEKLTSRRHDRLGAR